MCEQPTRQVEMPQIPEYRVCAECLGKNLVQSITLNKCIKCSVLVCVHNTSSVDPLYCSECLKDITMTDETVLKTQEHYNEEKDKVYKKTHKARHISFSGSDWLFANRKINTLSETELALAIEYHRTIYDGMIYERECRRMEHFHRNAGKPLPIKTSNGESISTEVTTTVSTETVTRKVSKPKASKTDPAALMAQLGQLLKSGLTPEQLKAMMGGK